MRLIDANRLIKKAYRSEMWNRSTQAFDLFVVDAEDVEDAPTIDAVEVVRCKDCINRDQAFRCIALYYGFNPHDHWFCANGRRDAEVEGCTGNT